MEAINDEILRDRLKRAADALGYEVGGNGTGMLLVSVACDLIDGCLGALSVAKLDRDQEATNATQALEGWAKARAEAGEQRRRADGLESILEGVRDSGATGYVNGLRRAQLAIDEVARETKTEDEASALNRAYNAIHDVVERECAGSTETLVRIEDAPKRDGDTSETEEMRKKLIALAESFDRVQEADPDLKLENSAREIVNAVFYGRALRNRETTQLETSETALDVFEATRASRERATRAVLGEWTERPAVDCVECPGCGFTFAAMHTDMAGGYSCPDCDAPHKLKPFGGIEAKIVLKLEPIAREKLAEWVNEAQAAIEKQAKALEAKREADRVALALAETRQLRIGIPNHVYDALHTALRESNMDTIDRELAAEWLETLQRLPDEPSPESGALEVFEATRASRERANEAVMGVSPPYPVVTAADIARDVEKLRNIPIPDMRGDQPWSIRDVVKKLVEAANVLLIEKSYDGHGYESINAARDAAADWLIDNERLRLMVEHGIAESEVAEYMRPFVASVKP